MSNFLGPATVTAALALMLEERIAADITDFSFTVTPGKPTATDNTDQASVLLYLYQVIEDPQWRNADLPTRNSRGQIIQQPRAAIDLHYLLTFYGVESELQPQRLMSSVLHILHGQPVLTPSWIDFARNHADYPFLTNSNLGNEIERVKITPLAFSLEELSKLWSILLQTSYSLSMAYTVSVVFVEPQTETSRALPVQERSVITVPSAAGEPIIAPDALDGLQLWLRSDRGLTYDEAGVSEWQDQSGNDRHASQDDADLRPQLVSHGIGRLPVLRFDGDDDRLALDWSLSLSLAAVTACAIVRTENTDAQAILSFDTAEYWELQVSDGAATPRAQWLTADNTSTQAGLPATRATDDTQWHALYADFDGSGSDDKRFFIDGVAAGTATSHSGDIGTGATRFGLIGAGSAATAFNGAAAGRFCAGDLAEIVVYERRLIDEEREQLERYFAKRYSNI